MELVSLKAAIKEHPEYRGWLPSLEMYRDLYTGGAQLKSKASRYLYRRHRESMDVYQERVSRAYYENYVGSIIDWFASTLFRREPVVTVEGAAAQNAAYYADFFQNCDRTRTSITDFLRQRFIESLIYGKSYCALEFPKAAQKFRSRLEEQQAGADRAYLSAIHPTDVINWGRSETGALSFLTIQLEAGRVDAAAPEEAPAPRFLVYSESEYFIVERDKEGNVIVLESGPHATSKAKQVPVFQLSTTDGLWLMNKAAHLQVEHFNKSNGLAWSLGTSLFATPVIYSRREFNQVIGESYYIHLDPEDKFGFTEPEGTVYKIALENLARLQEEIYRTCYLLGQSRSWLSGSVQTSGHSKKQDYQVTQEVLRAYGDGVKDFLKRILETLAIVRGDQVRVTVSGLDEFEVGEFQQELAEAESLLSLGMESKTFRKQVFKKLALKFLADVNETTKERIAREIEESVDKVEP